MSNNFSRADEDALLAEADYHERRITREARRPGHRVQRWYCSDCECEHEASVLGGVAVPPLESVPLQSLKEVESTRSEEEDYKQ